MTQVPPPTVPPTTPPPPGGGGGYTPPPPPPSPPGGAAGSDRTIMLVLAYLGILALIPLLTKKDDREVQWHAKNGLAIMVAEIAIVIVISLLDYFFLGGCITGIFWCIFPLAVLVIAVLGIVKATNGQRFRIPMVSDFADKM